MTTDRKDPIGIIEKIGIIEGVEIGGFSTVHVANAIMQLESVLDAVIVGVMFEGDILLGFKALVVPKGEFRGKLREEDVRNYLKSLNRFPEEWLPDRVIFVESIPRTSTGNLDKKEVIRILFSEGNSGNKKDT
ncbi:hypothetical protein HS1genome_1625 [Sulfodiicoccus acidiphilus]|uniref:AMP-binding enzyme C-terminal domain-containing protein n=1 Tax=Sulfodiicoccus acidiphilus TaxID=1670455 RepID=A0A348B4Y4_9CREN|nr:hypothetical protein [Sulfodiicoccus acidiphilus]BBD73236.1 hypothetical protein HS1genome_1625 [Sulfodiicoccus acidiphilus]GGT89705.1 hypothetical protein GCM10007116_04440 [Sulfodiicoccus acidiphilus]